MAKTDENQKLFAIYNDKDELKNFMLILRNIELKNLS